MSLLTGFLSLYTFVTIFLCQRSLSRLCTLPWRMEPTLREYLWYDLLRNIDFSQGHLSGSHLYLKKLEPWTLRVYLGFRWKSSWVPWPNIIVPVYNPSTWEMKAERSAVWGTPGLHSEILCVDNKTWTHITMLPLSTVQVTYPLWALVCSAKLWQILLRSSKDYIKQCSCKALETSTTRDCLLLLLFRLKTTSLPTSS